MAYESIIVKGKKYQYEVGIRETKIDGVGVFYNECIADENEDGSFNVTPAIVADLIAQRRVLEPFHDDTED